MRTYSNPGTLSTLSNNNNLYFGTTSANNIFYDDMAGTSIKFMSDYRSYMYPRETNSFSENTPFTDLVRHPYDLHIPTGSLTQCESGGATVSSPVSITTDYDQEPRYPNPGYPNNPSFPATAPDVGADEFAAKTNDIVPPVIVCTPLANTSSIQPRNITATITDATGINQTPGGMPRLYWKVSRNGTWNATVATTSGSNLFTFTFGAGVVMGDTVYYYIAAQDNAATANVSGFPGAGTTGFSADPPYCLPPTTPMSYRVIPSISGIFPVGIGQTFETLTAAVNTLNGSELTGPVVFELYDNSYPSETFPITINPAVGLSSSNTLTIRPLAGISPVITGTSTEGIIKISGADFVTIDGSNSGGSDRSLALENTNGASNSYTIGFFSNNGDGAKFCTIKNCIIRNKPEISNNTFGIAFELGSTGGDHDNVTIDNNLICSVRWAIYYRGGTAGISSNGKIINNTIGSETAGSSVSYRAITCISVDSLLIENNDIFGAPEGNSNYGQAGIYLFGGSTHTKITRNKIHDFYYTGTSDLSNWGIYYASDASTVTEISNNLIYNIKSARKPVGIQFGTGGNAKIYYNTIRFEGAYLHPTATTFAACIYVNSGIVSLDLRNNIFENSLTPSATNTNIKTYAIYNAGTTSPFTVIDYNDYFIDGTNPNIGYWGSAQPTLANWQALTLQDSHSLTIDPRFPGTTSFIPNSGGVNNVGIVVPEVSIDFMGVSRQNPPDMGAYEINIEPRMNTLPATSVTGTGGVFNGTANANNNPAITPGFEYGLTPSYGSEIPAVPSSISGFPEIQINAEVSGLVPNSTYHYRAKGANSQGAFYGSDLTMNTLAIQPEAVTTVASEITGSSAVLSGSVNANNSTTTVSFEYGASTMYGSTVDANQSPVNGIAATPVSVSVSGLSENLLYHYRVVATNQAGTAYGEDKTFMTTVGIPPTISLTGTISGDTCFNATDSILVAGTPEVFIVTPTGNVTLIAGETIRLLPGTKVDLAGYLYAYITTTGIYCLPPLKSISPAMTGYNIDQPLAGTPGSAPELKLWPNPATDQFSINIPPAQDTAPNIVEVYNMSGILVVHSETYEAFPTISIDQLSSGIFFVKVRTATGTQTIKMIKL